MVKVTPISGDGTFGAVSKRRWVQAEIVCEGHRAIKEMFFWLASGHVNPSNPPCQFLQKACDSVNIFLRVM